MPFEPKLMQQIEGWVGEQGSISPIGNNLTRGGWNDGSARRTLPLMSGVSIKLMIEDGTD